MRRVRGWPSRVRLAILLAAGLVLSVLPAGGEPAVSIPTTGAIAAPEPLRVLPLGASSTEGAGSPATAGYRCLLLDRLDADHVAVDFVGSRRGGPASLRDRDHEGHSGWTLQRMIPQVRGWVRQADPDVVLLHMGTNDLNSGAPAAVVAARLDRLLDELYAAAPRAHVIVAGVWAPLRGKAAARAELVRLTPGVVERHRALGRSIEFVDTSALLSAADFGDGLHANAGGYRKIAAMWAEELEDWLAGRPRRGAAG